MKNKCVIYARVSRDSQSLKLQLDELHSYAKRNGLEVVRVYKEQGISGSLKYRPSLNELMADAKDKKFAHVIVWKFDRFARSLPHLIEALDFFKKRGIDFVSIREKLDTSTPMGQVFFHIIGAFAQLEHSICSERIKAGMAAAARRGAKFGNKRKVDWDRVVFLWKQHLEYKEIAERLGITFQAVHNILKKKGMLKPRIGPRINIGS